MSDDKFLLRRDFRFFRAAKNQKAVASNILEAITQLGVGEDGRTLPPRRVKIVVKKKDLDQVLEAIRDRDGAVRRGISASAPAAGSLEQRLSLMRRRQSLRAASQVKSRSRLGLGTWSPVLKSIPEEV